MKKELLTAAFALFIATGSSYIHAQDKPAPPRELVDRVIVLYKAQGEPLTPGFIEDSQKYIGIMGKDLENLQSFDLVGLEDKEIKETLASSYNDYAIAYDNLFLEMKNERDFKKAEEMWNLAIKLKPYGLTIWRNLATSYAYDKGDYRKAIEILDNGLVENPGNKGLIEKRERYLKEMEQK